jgi:hypothetical protein
MAKINEGWHRAHPMPKDATLEQRIRWHVAHATACGCREIPGTVLQALKVRGIKPPARRR